MSQPAVGAAPFAVAAGDVTGDGVADIVSADSESNTITVLKAEGGGKFSKLRALATAAEPRDLQLTDLNADGRLDVLAVAFGGDVLQVWLGQGNGSFTGPANFATGDGPVALAVADLNADGKPDVVVGDALGNQAAVLLGSGSGGFAPRVDHATGPGPSSVAVADFNGDGKPDLAIANSANDTVSLLAGLGGGSFAPPSTVAAGSAPRDIVAADVNGDGKTDLVVANWSGSSLSLLAGQGNGTFAAAVTLAVPALPTALGYVDLDQDGKGELVVAHETSFPNQISILAGLGGGNFAPAAMQDVAGIRPRGLVLNDLNNDGVPDLVLAAATGGVASVLLGNCAPSMNIAPRADVDIGASYSLRKSPLWKDRSRESEGEVLTATSVMTHQDLDRDGDIDLVRASIRWLPGWQFIDTPVEVFRNDSGNFSDQTSVLIPGAHPPMRYARKGLNGDFNGDGWPDVALLDHGDDVPEAPGAPSSLYLSDGGGTLHYSPVLEQWPGFTHGGAAADIDGNGSVDLLMVDSNTTPFLLINDGTGGFVRDTARLPLSLLRPLVFVAEMLDLDSDGFVDIVASGNRFVGEPLGVIVYWGGPKGLYRDSSRYEFPTPAGWGGVLDLAAEDMDHDGDRDLVINRFPDGFGVGRYFQVLRQTSPRMFVDETSTRMVMDTSQDSFDYLRMQDVNGDGHVDMFIDDRRFELLGEAVWTNDGSGHFAPYQGAVSPSLPYTSIDIADEAVTEGQNGTKQLVFQVRLNRPAGSPVSFDIATGIGTATAGVDYVAKSTTGVVIGVGQSSASFSVTVNGDVAAETDESFSVVLSNVAGAKVLRGRGYGFIENDDVYQLSVNDASLPEGNAGQSQAEFTISLSAPAPTPVSFDVSTAPGTAAPGIDYVSSAQSGKTIAAGQTSTTFSVPVTGDTAVEGNETFTLNLANSVGATLLDPQGQGRIVNDDLAQLSVSDAAIAEGNAGGSTLSFVVRLSHSMPSPVTFDIATASGTATGGSDFVARALTGRFLDAGRTQWRFEVQVNGDAQVEPDETFSAVVSNVVGAGVADATATGSILNDDAAASRAAGARIRPGAGVGGKPSAASASRAGQAGRPRNRAP